MNDNERHFGAGGSMNILLRMGQAVCKHKPHVARVIQAAYVMGRTFNCVHQIRCAKCNKYLRDKYVMDESHRWDKYYGEQWPQTKAEYDRIDSNSADLSARGD